MTDWIEVGDSTAKTWDKEKPVQGTFVNIQTEVGPNKSNMYTLRTKDGDVSVWGSAVIDSKFEQVPKGAEVRIEPLGMVTGKSGKEYADYKFMYRETPMEEILDADEVSDLDGII